MGAAAAAVVIAVHALVVFKGQKAAFLFLMSDSHIEPFTSTVIAASVLLGWSVLNMIYQQTQMTDYSMVDWEQGKLTLNKEEIGRAHV